MWTACCSDKSLPHRLLEVYDLFGLELPGLLEELSGELPARAWGPTLIKAFLDLSTPLVG